MNACSNTISQALHVCNIKQQNMCFREWSNIINIGGGYGGMTTVGIHMRVVVNIYPSKVVAR